MKNIVLVGFMGTGKTTLAKALAKEMDKIYVSVDELVALREKKSINDIFREQGEPYFRKVESRIVEEISENTDQVIDAGGGVVLDIKNMNALRKNGIIVCLWAGPHAIYERTKGHGHRPLLNVDDPEGRIKELLDKRRPFYEKADFHIDTTDFDVKDIVNKIKGIIDEA